METKVANPTALGLFGFGVTTTLLSLANLGVIDLSIVIIAVAIVLGGFAEIFAGLFELKLGNTFAGTVFVSFGLFWLSLVLILLLPTLGPVTGDLVVGLGVYLLLFALYSLLLFVDTLKSLLTLKILLLLVFLLFFTLGIFYVSAIAIFLTLGGIIGVIAGLLGIYMCTGMILNEDWGEEVFKL
ncbi:MAG: acetate uptake transporter [Methanobrevibacter sp.]|nr:acetate uptake transporter [Methanobrevibacter sp.]MCL2156832.1 acetate uptake transporter [Methanobrevibacter sp.]MCL2157362.1 acetate uptake transporter [Methanobrevibacter sp.]